MISCILLPLASQFVWFVTHCRSPKGDLALLQTVAFTGATLYSIGDLHGFAVRLFSGFVVNKYVFSTYKKYLLVRTEKGEGISNG